MELRHLRYFVAIAEERSFTRAAERLWVAQPGLSTQIRRLEAELGVQLFDRHTRGVDLTDAGVLFLERARAALSAADVAGAIGRDLETGVAGSVKLGVATCAQWGPTSDLLERFTRERSGVQLTVLEGYGGTLWCELRSGRLDALLAPASFSSPDLRRIDLGGERWVALVGTSHPLAGIGPLGVDQLHGERVAVTGHPDGAGYDRAVTEMLDDSSVTADLFPGAPGPALHGAVVAGEAIALTTAPQNLRPGVMVRPLDPRRMLPFNLLWRDETPSAALSEFVRIAVTNAERRPAKLRPLAAVA
jgi:DNA-binding transcriptional LysR family regulator